MKKCTDCKFHDDYRGLCWYNKRMWAYFGNRAEKCEFYQEGEYNPEELETNGYK